jgi:hypothetical protein
VSPAVIEASGAGRIPPVLYMSPHDQRGSFTTTHWSEVSQAGAADPTLRRDVLERLIRQYAPAFRAHLIGYKRIPAEQAEELLQGFLCDQIVSADLIAHADRTRGRLRTFLLLALDRYVLKARRYARAGKRGGGVPLLSIDDQGIDPVGDRAEASAAFDVAWAREVVDQALRQMQLECQRSDRPDIWELFECRLVGPLLSGTTAPRYQSLVERFGFKSPTQASNLLITAKRMFARTLRETIAAYSSDDQVEEELHDLWTIFSHARTDGDMEILLQE